MNSYFAVEFQNRDNSVINISNFSQDALTYIMSQLTGIFMNTFGGDSTDVSLVNKSDTLAYVNISRRAIDGPTAPIPDQQIIRNIVYVYPGGALRRKDIIKVKFYPSSRFNLDKTIGSKSKIQALRDIYEKHTGQSSSAVGPASIIAKMANLRIPKQALQGGKTRKTRVKK